MNLALLPRIFACTIGLMLSCASLAHADPVKWVNEGGEISYTVVHKFHEVKGVSKDVEVMALLDAQGLKVMARAAIKSFNSGNSSRDAHVLEVVDAAHHPTVTVRALAAGFTLPQLGQTIKVTLKGEIELHGVKTNKPIAVEVHGVDASHVTISFTLEDSITEHQVERPSLLFVAVDDRLGIAGRFTMHTVTVP